jgi:AhpC/TSA family
LFFISGIPNCRVYQQALACPKSCLKDGGVPKSPCLTIALRDIDGRTYSLAEVRGPKGTLVVFIYNHCPYVKASISRVVAEANALRGIGTIAIMPNDTDAYPEAVDKPTS